MQREPYQGAWVKYHREQLGITQGELAEAARDGGVQLSRSHLANIEAGTYGVPPGLVRIVADLAELDLPEVRRHIDMLARTKNDPGRTLHPLSQLADSGPTPLPSIPDSPPPPRSHPSAIELLDWASKKLASLALSHPRQVVLTTTGPLADALRAAPSPRGYLGGILGNGIRAVLEEGAELHHILAVPDDPEAHFEVLAQALPLAARYCLPPPPAFKHLSRYRLTLVPDFPAGPDLVASSHTHQASMVIPVLTPAKPGVAVVELAQDQDAQPDAGSNRAWPADYAEWLGARGIDLFSWVSVVPAGTLSMPTGPWEEFLTVAWEHAGGRDSIQRMLPLNTMSNDLRSQLVAAQERRRGLSPGKVAKEVGRRMSMYKDRRGAMLRNLEHGYTFRNVVTREALADLAEHGQYTMERVPDNVLTAGQAASYLQATIDLIRTYENFEVLILTDEELEQALPLGVSWIVKRSPRRQTVGSERAWAFLPYILNDEPKAMNVIVDDRHAIEAIGSRIDALWTTWVRRRSAKDVRQDTLAELERLQHDIAS